MPDPIIPDDPGTALYYRAVVQFDAAESDAQHKSWLGAMYDHLRGIASGADPIGDLLVETLPGSNSMTVVVFAADLNATGRRSRLNDIAQKHKGAQLYGPTPMRPNPWPFHHRR